MTEAHELSPPQRRVWRLAAGAPDGALASVQRLCGDLDIRRFPLDGPLPDLPPSNAAKARQKMMIDLARRENLTIRQLARRFTFSLGHLVYVGTASAVRFNRILEQISPTIQTIFYTRAAVRGY